MDIVLNYVCAKDKHRNRFSSRPTLNAKTTSWPTLTSRNEKLLEFSCWFSFNMN